MAAFDAQVIAPGAATAGRVCVMCGGQASGYLDGRPCLCLACTLGELDTTEYLLALRVEFGISAKVCAARYYEHGGPAMTPEVWRTPRRKQRR